MVKSKDVGQEDSKFNSRASLGNKRNVNDQINSIEKSLVETEERIEGLRASLGFVLRAKDDSKGLVGGAVLKSTDSSPLEDKLADFQAKINEINYIINDIDGRIVI